MTSNNTLRWGLRLCNVILVFNILASAIFTAFILTSFFYANLTDDIILVDGFKSGFGIGNYKKVTTVEEGMLLFSSLSAIMKIWLLLRGVVFFVITIYGLLIVKKIIKSIKSLKTFYEGNIESFRLLAKLGFIASFISSFNFIFQEGISNFHFSIPFGTLAFGLGCLILSIVFEEGKALTEDKESII